MTFPFLALPTELKCKILGYSEVKEVAALSLTCKNLHDVSRDELERHRTWGTIQITRDFVSDRHSGTSKHLYNVLERLLCNSALGSYVKTLHVEDYGIPRADPFEYRYHTINIVQSAESRFFGKLERAMFENTIECKSLQEAESLLCQFHWEETSVVTAMLLRLSRLRKLQISTLDKEQGGWDSMYLPRLVNILESSAHTGDLPSRIFPHLVEVRLGKGLKNMVSCVSLFDLMSCFATLPTLKLLHAYGVGKSVNMTPNPGHVWADVPEKSSEVEDFAMSTPQRLVLEPRFLSKFKRLKRMTLEMVKLDLYSSEANDIIDDLIMHQREHLEYFRLTCHSYDSMFLTLNPTPRTSLVPFTELRCVRLDIATYCQTSKNIKSLFEQRKRVANVEDYETGSPRLDTVLPASIEEVTMCGEIEAGQIDRMLQDIPCHQEAKAPQTAFSAFQGCG